MSHETLKIIFTCYNETGLDGMIYLIKKMKECVSFYPILVSENVFYESSDYKVICYNVNEKKTRISSNINKQIHKGLFYKDTEIYIQYKNFRWAYRKCKKADLFAQELIQSEKPDCIIVPDDRAGGLSIALLKHARNCLIIRAPLAIQTDYDASFGERKNDKSLFVNKGIFCINGLQKVFSPYLLHTIDGETRAFYPFGIALAFSMVGMLPKSPWSIGTSFCTHVLVASERERKWVEKNVRFRKPYIEITGLVKDYEIVKTLNSKIRIKNYLIDKYKLSSDSVIIILSVPQFAEDGFVDWNTHRNNMRMICNELRTLNGIILFSLHPKSTLKDYQFLEQEGYGYICDEKLKDVICGADIFVVNRCSSTVYWAVLLEIRCFLIGLVDEHEGEMGYPRYLLTPFEPNVEDIGYRTSRVVKNVPYVISQILKN